MQVIEEQAAMGYTLEKHHLSKPSRAENVLQAVNDLVALHATSAGTPYMSLFARMKSFKKEDLDNELYRKRSLLRLRAMRNTLFITSTELAPLLHQAVKPQLMKWASLPISERGMSSSEYERLLRKIREILAGKAITIAEIKRELPDETRTVEVGVGKDLYRMSNVSIVLNMMIRQGIVVSEKGEGNIRTTKANRYTLLEDIYPHLDFDSVDPEAAKTMLIKRYLSTFSPVTENDVAWWTGFSKAEVENALASLGTDLIFTRISGFSKDYLMFKTDLKMLAKLSPPRLSEVLLLPYEDPFTKGYKIRDRLIDAEYEKTVYVGGGVQPTILLNGKIVGIWDRSVEMGRGPIVLRFFEECEDKIVEEATRKAKALGRLMTDKELHVAIR